MIRRRQDWAGYAFLLPWFGGMVFMVVPFFASLYLAFTDYDLLTPPRWAGLANFREMAGDVKLHQSL
jgi:multiple sugar transport system permease protein